MDLIPISIIGPRCPNNGPNKKTINILFHPRELLQLHQLRIESWCSDNSQSSETWDVVYSELIPCLSIDRDISTIFA